MILARFRAFFMVLYECKQITKPLRENERKIKFYGII